MAYTKIIPVRTRLDHCVDYVLNHEKTGLDRALGYISDPEKDTLPGEFGGITCLEATVNCTLESACQDMMGTKRHYGKTKGILAYHIIQSFAPGEVSAEEAHEIGLEFAQKLFGDRYEVVVSTHLDREHYHNHILINSVSYADGRKYRNSFADYYGGIREVSDRLCREHGLSVIEPDGHGQSYPKWEEVKAQPIRARIRQDVEAALTEAATFAEFIRELEARGYTVKYGPNVKHIAVRPPGGDRNIRLDSRGVDWPEGLIQERIEAGRYGEPLPPAPPDRQRSSPHPEPRYYRPRQSLPVRRGLKLHSIRALYLKYLYQMGIIPRRKPPKGAAFLPREEVRKFDRYVVQFKLIQRYRIDTQEQLPTLMDAIQAEMDDLTHRRSHYHKLRRQGQDTEGVAQAIAAATTRLRELRRDYKLCASIQENTARIKTMRPPAETEKGPKKEAKKRHVKNHGYRSH